MRPIRKTVKSICMKKEGIPVLISFLLILFLCLVPTGYEGALQYQTAERCKAKVISTDNDSIIDTGLVRSGEQVCTLYILDGKFEGQTAGPHFNVVSLLWVISVILFVGWSF